MYSISRTVYSELVSLIKKDTKCDADKAMELGDKICAMIENDVIKVGAPVNQAVNSVLGHTEKVEEKKVSAENAEEKKKRIEAMVRNGMGQVDKNGNFTPFGKQMLLNKDAKERG